MVLVCYNISVKKEEIAMDNTKIQKIEQAFAKIKQNYEDLRKEWLSLPVDFLVDKHYAYQIAHQQEAFYFFETIYENAEDYLDDTICDDDILDTIIEADVNWLYQIYQLWLDIDSERFNYFVWGDLQTLIIECVLRYRNRTK